MLFISHIAVYINSQFRNEAMLTAEFLKFLPIKITNMTQITFEPQLLCTSINFHFVWQTM